MQVLQSQGERVFLCRETFPYTDTLYTLYTTSQSAAPAQGLNTQRSTETPQHHTQSIRRLKSRYKLKTQKQRTQNKSKYFTKHFDRV